MAPEESKNQMVTPTRKRCTKFQRWEVALRYAYEAKNTTRFFLCWLMLQNLTLTMAQ